MSLRGGLARRVRRSFDRGVHRLAWVGYGIVPGARPGRRGLTFVRNVPYRPTGRRAHLLDVYQPQREGPHPAVLYVHGGAFSMLSKDTHRVMALALAARGYTVFNINYRLAPRHRYPAQLEDAAAALVWMLEHAREYGADPARIVLAGESAGGNLVTALAWCATNRRREPFARAVFERAPQIRAVLAIYGLLDVQDIERFWRRKKHMPWWLRAEIEAAARAYVGMPLEEKARAAPLASPLRLFEGRSDPDARPAPPFFVACGTADPLLDDSRRLAKALEGRGVPHCLSIHPGEIHGFNAMIWRPEARAKWRAVYKFLDEHV